MYGKATELQVVVLPSLVLFAVSKKVGGCTWRQENPVSNLQTTVHYTFSGARFSPEQLLCADLVGN